MSSILPNGDLVKWSAPVVVDTSSFQMPSLDEMVRLISKAEARVKITGVFDALSAGPRCTSARTRIPLATITSVPSLISTTLERRLNASCSIACDLLLLKQNGTLSVMHNNDSAFFPVPESEGDAVWDDIRRWVYVLHDFETDEDAPRHILRSRLREDEYDRYNYADGAYDIESGSYAVPVPVQSIGYITSRLDPDRIREEIAKKWVYHLAADDPNDDAYVVIKAAEYLPKVTKIYFKMSVAWY